MSKSITSIETKIFKHLGDGIPFCLKRVPRGSTIRTMTDTVTENREYFLFDTLLAKRRVDILYLRLVEPADPIATPLTLHRINALFTLATRANLITESVGPSQLEVL